jgi:hypothetical protein
MHWIDPDSLPVTMGEVERLIANPHGEADGIVLRDGTVVHVPPHLSTSLRAHLRPGSRIEVRGVRPRGVARMIAAVAVAPEDGPVIRDDGPLEEDPAREAARRDARAGRPPAEAAGIVRRGLHGPKGELRGALLEDGAVLRLGPKEAARVAALLSPGARLAARGWLTEVPEGRVLEVEEIGADMAALAPVKPPKHPKEPRQAKPPKHAEPPRHGASGQDAPVLLLPPPQPA